MACRRFLVGNLITRSPIARAMVPPRSLPPRCTHSHVVAVVGDRVQGVGILRIRCTHFEPLARSLTPSLAHPLSESLPARDPADFDLAVRRSVGAAVCALDEF